MTPQPPPSDSSSPEPEAPPGGRFQFKITTVLMVMVLISILAAVFGSYFRNKAEAAFKPRFVLLTLMVPLIVVVFFAVARALFGQRKSRRRKRF